MAVDPQVRGPDGRAYDVLFVGTTAGRILKIVNTADTSDRDRADGGGGRKSASSSSSSSSSSPPTLVEEIMLFRSDVPIESLK